MSQILKCDITGKSDVPTHKVSIPDVSQSPVEFEGERLTYIVSIWNQNGYSAIDVAQEYVLEEMIGIMTRRLNELRNPNSNQTEDKVGSPEIKEL